MRAAANLLALHLLDLAVYRLTRKRYALMPVDTLDAARGPLNDVIEHLHPTVSGRRVLDELDDAIYAAMVGRSCEVHNIFLAPIKRRLYAARANR